ncbi:MAG: tetracycline resistance MFS efflux pump [Armatimonadaceae bacterium]
MKKDSSTSASRSRRGPIDWSVFRPLLLLAVTVFIDLLGFGIILPNLPQYIETAVGPNHRDAAFIGALLAASYSLTQFLVAPLWGRYSDRVGRRPVILVSLLGVGLAFILFGLAGDRLWMLFAARLLAGLLSSASIGVSFAYVADVTPPEKRAMGLGLLGACFGLGFMMGPALGGLLGHFNLALPAFVAAGMALINFGFTWRYLPESLSVEERQKLAQQTRVNPVTLLGNVVTGPAGFLFVLTFIITFGFTALEQTFSFYLLAALGVTQENQPLVSGLILGMAGLSGILVQGVLIGPLVARFGEATIIRAGIVLMILGFATFALPQTPLWLALGPILLLSTGRPLAAPALSALVSRKADLGQGLTLSVSQSFDALARTVGPVIAGYLFAEVGPTSPYYVSAVAMLVALGVTWVKRKEMSEAEEIPVVPAEEADENREKDERRNKPSQRELGALR